MSAGQVHPNASNQSKKATKNGGGFFDRSSWGWGNFWGNKLKPKLWHSGANDDDTSQHLFDPYSTDHLTSGVIQYLLIPTFGAGKYCVNPSLTFGNENGEKFPLEWFLINFGIHFLWEFVENTPCFINGFRKQGYPEYSGDSIINSIGDLIVFAIGYISSWALCEYTHWSAVIGLIVLFQVIASCLGAGYLITMINICKGTEEMEEVPANDRRRSEYSDSEDEQQEDSNLIGQAL